ncbi:hypothetical protein Gpo141_00002843 [Globisporangium polare]
MDLYVAGSSNAAAYNSPSDRRFKTSIKELQSAASVIQRLRPVTYEWRRDEFPSRRFRSGVFAGFLADEVEQLLPQVVGHDAEGFRSLDYSAFVPHVVQALQEMQRTIDELTARVQQLETRSVKHARASARV